MKRNSTRKGTKLENQIREMSLFNAAYFSTFFLILFYVVATTGAEETEIGQDKDAVIARPKNSQRTTIILFGSLGDLSTRYLWPGFYNLFLSQDNLKNQEKYLRIHATGRKDKSIGNQKLSEIFETRLCKSKAINEDCAKEIPKFRKATSYHRTKTEEDYETLSQEIKSGIYNHGVTENLRIFYLSVPPFAYSGIMKFVHQYLRPENESTEIRIVFEKPFGQDQKSSESLHQEIMQYFTEKEVYRVDHYLGKQTVDEIVKFRANNKEVLKSFWNDRGIESVEIVMKEENDCKGRTEFYDEYGVILDVIQNHLTEIFARLVMDINDNATNEDFIKAKMNALKQTVFPDLGEIVAGQYADYNKHYQEERNPKTKDSAESFQPSRTPTFAAMKLTYNSKEWQRVPFFLMTGKLLNEKSGFVKINFKSKIDFKVSEIERSGQKETKKSYLKFYIYSSMHNGPALEISPSLKEAKFKFSTDWIESHTEDGTRLLKPIKNIDAYTFLIQKLYKGDKTYFVDIDSLLETWRIWDPVQSAIKNGKVLLKIYDKNDYEELDFSYHQSENEMRTKGGVQINEGESHNDFLPDGTIKFSTLNENRLLGNDLVSGSVENVIKSLSSTVINNINKAGDRNEIYHVAFPGGSSILPLLKRLCKQRNKFSTRFLNLWVLDERCVPLNDTKSNFKLLTDNLLNCLQLGYQNIHKMPVGHGDKLCKQQAAENYAQEIKDWIPSTKFDMIILGVGQDGHVASLFPKDDKSLTSSELVVVSESGPEGGIPRRMSMTLKLINSAKIISVIATGEKKRGIVKFLQENVEHPKLPIQKVKPINGSVVWYIDNTALGMDD
eukprot:Seg1354.10 transcript_id=Seg1354.10/GoldUCD/mRNA.D3Y31 product="GDH/6PGL endoplasmic bifunctional protein" protein_id=Seg1354.10/GoldUCD/D3Y31